MEPITEKKLQEFVLNFDNEIVAPLVSAGYERNKFNIFNILNISRQELRHSDFLAFLMNPNQSGDIGRQFLQNFLSLLSKENSELRLDFFKMFYCNFDKIVVKREYENIDILVDIVISNKKFVIVIENKVDSGEQFYDDKEVKGQLAKYKKIVDKEFSTHTPIFLFLSPDKHLPSESEWTSIDYNLIYSALCRINSDKADNTIKTLIEDYKKTIRGQFEMENDEKLREAVLEIYNANKDVFDYIYKNLPNRINATAEIIRNYLGKTDWIDFDSKKNKGQNTYIIFTTKELKALGLNINFQIDVKNMLLYFYIVGEFEYRTILGITDNKKNYKNIMPQQYMLGNNRNKNKDYIIEHEQLLLENNQEELQTQINDMMQKILAPEGFIYKQSKRIYELLNGVMK